MSLSLTVSQDSVFTLSNIPITIMYIRLFRIFQTSRYQGIVKATGSGVFEDIEFKISEGSDQN